MSLLPSPQGTLPPLIEVDVQSFPPQYEKESQILKTWLDKPSEFSNNRRKVYEKTNKLDF